MLVLSRKSTESVVVGGSGRLSQCSKSRYSRSRTGRVRLGFEADASVPVHRSEVWERIRESNGVGGSEIQRRSGGLRNRKKKQYEQREADRISWHGQVVRGDFGH